MTGHFGARRGSSCRVAWRTSSTLLGVMIVAVSVAWPGSDGAEWQIGSAALAAGVDAVGVAAPAGFAEVIERVRPAVVGVLSIGGRDVNTPAEVGKMVNDARTHSKHAILVRIMRGETTSFVAVPIG